MDDPNYYSYFWVKKQYEKISFIVGPNNNKSSNSSAWFVVYGDKHKILHESIVRQTDLPRQVAKGDGMISTTERCSKVIPWSGQRNMRT